MKKWQIAISILLVFALGTAAGAYGSRVIFKKRVSRALRTEGSPGVKVIQGMMDRLDLSESQRASINAIIAENNEKWETIRQEYEPKIKELYETVIAETKKELTDEQREEIETMSAKVQRRLPPRNASPPRSSTPPDSSSPPRSSNPSETSGPHSMSQSFGLKSDANRVAGMMEKLQIEEEKYARVQAIVEEDLQRQQELRDEFEGSQAAAEQKFQEDLADIQVSIDKKLEKLLTREQLETYRKLMTPEEFPPEEPRPDNFGDGFGFEGYGDGMAPEDFNQGDFPFPEGQQTRNQDARSI